MRVHTLREYGRTVVVLPLWLVKALSPVFGPSLPHRGRVLRLVGRRRGPVLRSTYGLW